MTTQIDVKLFTEEDVLVWLDTVYECPTCWHILKLFKDYFRYNKAVANLSFGTLSRCISLFRPDIWKCSYDVNTALVSLLTKYPQPTVNYSQILHCADDAWKHVYANNLDYSYNRDTGDQYTRYRSEAFEYCFTERVNPGDFESIFNSDVHKFRSITIRFTTAQLFSYTQKSVSYAAAQDLLTSRVCTEVAVILTKNGWVIRDV